jgi:endonuclease YncB( thermonuclease family)
VTRAALLAGVLALCAAASLPAGAEAADRDCSDFTSQGEAQTFYEQAGPGDPNNLDGDGDGIVCEDLPCPCGAGAGSVPPVDVAAEPAVPAGQRLQGRVLDAVDGDTLDVDLEAGGEIDVRLIGIDTPETHRPGTPIECGGPQASARMHRLADGRGVALVTDPSQDRFDRYGRLLAYAIRRGGLNLNLAMVRSGWAEVYVYEDNPFRRFNAFDRAERSARRADRGVWARCGGDFHSSG